MRLAADLGGGVPAERTLFLDPQRCIGCRACMEACSECPGHGGIPMIHLDFVDRSRTVQTAPTVCMHCEDPACAAVCPTEAILTSGDGVVHSAMSERCIGCGHCALACPFGVPKIDESFALMMKCDLCYDRSAAGLAPMCATVCPSGALFYGTRADVEDLRQSRPAARVRFGEVEIRTRIEILVPAGGGGMAVREGEPHLPSAAERALEEVLL